MSHELAYQAGKSVFATLFPKAASTSIVSQRQFRFLRAVRAGAGGSRRRVTEAPAHRAELTYASINHDLCRAARSVRTGQEYAFFEFHRLGQGREGPQISIVQQEHDAAAVGQTAGFDRRMQMKADGEFAGGAGVKCLAFGGCKYVLAVEGEAVRTKL